MPHPRSLCLALGLMAAPLLSAQPPAAPLWEGLDPGANAVGFRSYWRRDWTRTWTLSSDAAGRPLAAPAARPVRLSVWYPARRGGKPMRFADYIDPARTPGFEAEERLIRDADVGDGIGPGFRRIVRSQALYDALLATPMAAARDAPVAPGRHPMVIYALGQGDYTQEDIPFCEYLASRGFIVVSVPQLGTSPRRTILFIHDPPSYDAQVSDLAFALATIVRDFPSADSSRVGAVGMSMGGVYATLLALRNSAVRVVVGRDPSLVAKVSPYQYRYWEAPEFDAARFRGHMLVTYRRENEPRERIVDSLRFADRELIRLPFLAHTDFTGYPEYSRHWPTDAIDSSALARRTPVQALETYAATTRYVGCYLDALLARGRGDARQCPPISGAEVERLPAAPGPTEEELYGEMRARGLDAAIQLYRRTAPAAAPDPNMRRTVMVRIANELGYAGRPRDEAEYSQLIATVFPDAPAYEHAGDRWAAIKEAARARDAYQHALRLEPGRQGVKDKLSALD
jgi:Dienelactone hydrolase and related enzymes